jgi:hypothetical protein
LSKGVIMPDEAVFDAVERVGAFSPKRIDFIEDACSDPQTSRCAGTLDCF